MNDRCPYGSGRPLWFALSSFHPPVVSIATDSQVVAFPTLHAKMGHAIDPFEWVFAFCTAGIIADIQCIGWTDAVQHVDSTAASRRPHRKWFPLVRAHHVTGR